VLKGGKLENGKRKMERIENYINGRWVGSKSGETFKRDLESGIVYINASTIGAEIQLPFGGIKQTGYGRKEAGGRGGALDTYSRWKLIYRDFSRKLQKAQIDKE
jgi:acyl-CoA reductase-like NAD-dependent aldehyde dehydrogenase